MKINRKQLLETIRQILKEEKGVDLFAHKYSKEEKFKKQIEATNRKIQEYIANGSEGDLVLTGTSITSLPDNLKTVNGKLNIERTDISKLPEGLKANSILARGSALEVLPQTLECDKLDIRETSVKEIPMNIVVHTAILTDTRTIKYPQQLEDQIVFGYGVGMGQVKMYNVQPEVVVRVGKRVKKVKGIQMSLAEVGGKVYKEFYFKYRDLTRSDEHESWLIKYYERKIREDVLEIDKALGIKFTTVVLLVKLYNSSFDFGYILKGTDSQGREILRVRNARKNLEMLISEQGQISTLSFVWDRLTDRQVQEFNSKLFPGSVAKQQEAVPIRQLMTGPKSKTVYWKIGKKKRGGHGIQGQAKDIIPSLSGATQDKLAVFAKKYQVTWGDMMVFDRNYAISVVARSTEADEQGNFLYFDKIGGSYSGAIVFRDKDYTLSR